MYDLATIVLHSVGSPWWYYLVFVVGAGGLGGVMYGGYRAIRNIAEILMVLQGTRGGKGVRAVKPLVEIVDGLASEVTDIKTEITCNGGQANTLGDRAVRTERSVIALQNTVHDQHAELTARDDAVKTALEARSDAIQAALETHGLDEVTVLASLQKGVDEIRVTLAEAEHALNKHVLDDTTIQASLQEGVDKLRVAIAQVEH